MEKDLEIAIRELHARTGHYVRKAGQKQRFIITDHGKPVAELNPLTGNSEKTESRTWKNRALLPEFSDVDAESIGGRDSTQLVAEEREPGSSW